MNLRSVAATVAACSAALFAVIPLPFQRLAVRQRVVLLVTDRLSLTESAPRPVHRGTSRATGALTVCKRLITDGTNLISTNNIYLYKIDLYMNPRTWHTGVKKRGGKTESYRSEITRGKGDGSRQALEKKV